MRARAVRSLVCVTCCYFNQAERETLEVKRRVHSGNSRLASFRINNKTSRGRVRRVGYDVSGGFSLLFCADTAA